MAGSNAVIQFYFAHPGDLSIPDVGWRGDLREAEQWADQRLTTLQALIRAPTELCPLVVRIVSEGEVVWSRVDSVAAVVSVHGVGSGRDGATVRKFRPGSPLLGTKSMR